jgi:hypothetical protein
MEFSEIKAPTQVSRPTFPSPGGLDGFQCPKTQLFRFKEAKLNVDLLRFIPESAVNWNEAVSGLHKRGQAYA